MSAFVLEIGTEELPARFLSGLEVELTNRFNSALAEHGLMFSGLSVSSTPRRLVVYVNELAEQAVTREEVVTGPSIKAAFDNGGRPTRAAEGFAKTHGVELQDTFTLETDKGQYIAVRKTVGGGAALEILAQICPAIITALPFPKKMRWASGEFAFARPLRWILALFGANLVSFSVADKISGQTTNGHRVHSQQNIVVPRAEDFFALLEEKGGITVNTALRRKLIKEQGNVLAQAQNGKVLWKDSLLDEVQGLCEHPVPILGSFDPSFLEVPKEVLLTSMESHQKSFGLEDSTGKLLPYFLTVLNIDPKDPALVRKGWERVLRARLEDARFFWRTDLANNFDAWLESLDSVTFLAAIGSIGDKTRRISTLCAWLAENIKLPANLSPVLAQDAARAGRICKADLVSEMVKEFDTLQGIMGSIYAERKGENPVVAKAIAEQYLPAGPDSPVPASLCGAILSMADKADTLAGCFGLGLIPTGTADPYALRRAVLGIARIMEEHCLRFDVQALFIKALEAYGQRAWKLEPDHAVARLQEFFFLRLKNHFMAQGNETLLVEATLLADATDVWGASARLSALSAFSNTADFAQAVLTFKRAANIIRKATEDLTGEYNTALLVDDAEKALAKELERTIPVFEAMWKDDNYLELFSILRQLRPFVDEFFDKVMVNCEEQDVRLNRLNLLKALVNLLGKLADFSALQI